MKQDYSTCRLSLRQWAGTVLLGTGIYLAGDMLLYRSLWLLLGLVPFLVWFSGRIKKLCHRKRMKRFREQFLMLLSSFVISLRAGYAAENAIAECRRDLEGAAGKESDLVQELIYMQRQLQVSVPLEQLFTDLGERSGQSAVQNFAEIFAIGKRTGGDLDEILAFTVTHLRQYMEMQKDIEAEIASRRMEQNIMSLVPWGILLYMQAASPSYMEPLYTTFAGRIAASAALLLYTGAFLWGRRITSIEIQEI